MLLDRLMPHCDFFERHSTLVHATPERVYAAIRTADLTSHPITRALLTLRGIRHRTGLPNTFAILADDPPRELVLGLQGPFWKPNCKLHEVNAETFLAPVPSGAARGGWNFFLERSGDATRLTTETRVLCAGDARLKFRLYWLIVRPFSGLIRRLMLRAIRKEAER